MRDNSTLLRGAAQLGIELDKRQQQQFEQYYEYLIEQNEVMNLTAITEYEEVLCKHFLDSLLLVKTGIDLKNKRVLDVGTGAGFPGIPLKIAFPDTEFVLMDSLNKRVAFLERLIGRLELAKITAVHARAEEAAKKEEYREQFDYCVSRAVARLATLSEYCIPFVKRDGVFISYKADHCEEECKEARKAAELLAGGKIKIRKIMLPETDMERVFIMIKKEKTTPPGYPRGQGKPQKQPLV